MPKDDVHTVYRKDTDDWANKRPGAEQASSVHRTKDEAVTRGRELARNSKSEHQIHKKDGTIGEKNSYGNDPSSIPG